MTLMSYRGRRELSCGNYPTLSNDKISTRQGQSPYRMSPIFSISQIRFIAIAPGSLQFFNFSNTLKIVNSPYNEKFNSLAP